MAITLSDLARDKRTLSVSVAGGSIEIAYRPSGLTPDVEQRLREAQADNKSGDVLIDFLLATLVSWDLLVEEEGETVEIDRQALRQLPIVFLSQLVAAIGADMAANPTMSAASGGGSSPKAR